MHHPLHNLDLDRLAVLLAGCAIGRLVDYHHTLPTAMSRGHDLASLPTTPPGALVFCEEQTAGRGRSARQWHAAPATSLLAGFILKRPLVPNQPAQIPMLAGIAVTRALVETEPSLAGRVWLKWPNDVLLGPDPLSARKVAGILVEAVFAQDSLDHAVLGIGVNVNQTDITLPDADDHAVPPASLRQTLGHPVDRTALLASLCWNLASQLVPPRAPEDILAGWRALLAHLGRPVVVRPHFDRSREIAGTAIDVTSSGDLIVEDARGVRHTVSAADVSLRSTP